MKANRKYRQICIHILDVYAYIHIHTCTLSLDEVTHTCITPRHCGTRLLCAHTVWQPLTQTHTGLQPNSAAFAKIHQIYTTSHTLKQCLVLGVMDVHTPRGDTVKSLYRGHTWISHFVHSRGVVHSSEVKNILTLRIGNMILVPQKSPSYRGNLRFLTSDQCIL